ncbi:MAG TPA: FkbM family methyltransferase [Burkholderiaceae bacterium]|nr:FkbM family methyltransferase [Burkholderiaceae bacterium]
MATLARDAARAAGLLSAIKRGLMHVNFEMRSRLYGAEITVPSIRGMRCDATEPFMLEVLRRALAGRPGAVIDVGVNRGQTLVKVKSIDPARLYVGFEPNPACSFYLHELIKANAYQHCTVLPVGLFTRDDVLALLMISDTSSDSAASLIEDLRPASSVRRVIHVPVMRYETIAHHLEGKVAVIKIDVEGAELEVLQTLTPIIERDRPVVLLEVLPPGLDATPVRMERQAAIEQLLKSRGYVIDRVLKDAGGAFVGVERITDFGVHDDLTRCDYVLSSES